MSKPGINFEGLKENLRKAAEEQRKNRNQPATEGEDLNLLPFPVTQEICAKWIHWKWEPCGDVNVWGILYTKDYEDDGTVHKKGDYEVQFSPKNIASIGSFSQEHAKAIGHALMSAANWKNVWKEHAGKFLEMSLMGEDEDGDGKDGDGKDE
ncbi:hypothetical protein MADRUGA_90 [Mycobacterium phage Madruga]|uniref:Uncharacterized protein n=1 Tax=Mycobacterium phage Madruga TaxID=1675552 RepID=A0A0K1LSC5_9CAUD|nr:hypothetical protein MADRUGA_90 [Mycobacterium phage Madruga]